MVWNGDPLKAPYAEITVWCNPPTPPDDWPAEADSYEYAYLSGVHADKNPTIELV